MRNAFNWFVAGGVSLFMAGTAIFGQEPVKGASSEMETLFAQALEDYNHLVEEIGEERLPLVSRISELEDENSQLRRDASRFRRIVNDGKAEIETLNEELQNLTAQSDYVMRSLEEYLVKFESRIHLAEDQRYKDDLLRIRESIDQESQSTAAVFALQTEALNLGLGRAEASLGGTFFNGRAIGTGGNVWTGEVAVLGPAAYFVADNGEASGVLRFHSGTVEPEVVNLDEPYGSEVSEVVKTGEGSLPVDASLGNAISLETANLTFIEHIQQGGYVGYFILALGGIALLLSVIKLGDMRRSSLVSQDAVQEVALTARREGPEAANKQAENLKGPLGEMVRMGIRNLGSSAVLLEEMMLSVILKKRPEMERFLPFLAITAAAAPLLGLLGTVVGMIKTFALITIFGTGDPKALSSGISEALVTTELGLAVAIPTLVLHGLFMRMVKSRVGVMEQAAFDFVKIVTSREED